MNNKKKQILYLLIATAVAVVLCGVLIHYQQYKLAPLTAVLPSTILAINSLRGEKEK